MMFRPERCVVIIVATAILHNICIDRRLPAPEVDDAASDSDGDEGGGDSSMYAREVPRQIRKGGCVNYDVTHCIILVLSLTFTPNP